MIPAIRNQLFPEALRPLTSISMVIGVARPLGSR